ncbi:MAG: THUMP domain-containing protein [Flavobacteriales bacterium]|nr:THUMP domain-containing protein [Flavobacteriales bacterium]
MPKLKAANNSNFEMIAKTYHGLEDVLAKELLQLGAQDIKTLRRAVKFKGDIGFMYKANLSLRTAVRIIKPIKTFKVSNETEFYDSIRAIDWNQYMTIDDKFAVDAFVNSTYFNHSLYIALKTKDAIVDQFRDNCGMRPDVDLDHPNLRINIHINEDLCTVSLDSSGKSLHKRGYRLETNEAPISEALAAGLILVSGWDKKSHFVDGMCGSGTFLVEAAMIAANIPANINRAHFAFEDWPDFDQNLWELIKESQLKKLKDCYGKIIGYDIDPQTLASAKINIQNAGLEDYIDLKCKNFFDTVKPEGPTHLVFNPPYGVRLQADIPQMYQSIGDTLKKSYSGAEAWFLTSHMEGLKHVGLRASRKIEIFQAKLECRFVKYEMYKGTKKVKSSKD